MPYHLGKSKQCPAGKPFAVLKEDGTPAPGGCHATHADALRHQRALQVNVEDASARLVAGLESQEQADRDRLDHLKSLT